MYREIEREIYKYQRGREKDRRERDTDRQENRHTKIDKESLTDIEKNIERYR